MSLSSVPGYQVIRKVGDGGMSSVYLAIQLSVGREVALKVLSPELRTDPTFGERFYREANIVGGLSHPNVIAIYDVFRQGKQYFMAMDYLPGDSCKDLIKKKDITPLRALEILRDIASALDYVHSHNYIHCDIKPDNILFRKNGKAVLTDFGIARELPDEKTHSVAGTPYYMSPEQAQGHKLTFQLPYLGKDSIAVAIKHVSAPIPKLPEQLSAFSPLLSKMLAKRPGGRFQNCNELLHAIDFIESQYLKQKNKSLPTKLKITFTLEKIRSRINSLLGLRKRLVYSFKHGLILKLVEEEVAVDEIENIAKTIEQNSLPKNTATTINMAGLTSDSLMLALETEQARKIIPAPLMNLFLVALLALILTPVMEKAITNLLNETSKPEIIYID